MKTLAAILAVSVLASCGVPVSLTTRYVDPDSGLVVSARYSSKAGIEIEATK